MLGGEFSALTRLHYLASSAVWIRPPFEVERRSTSDSVAESGQFRRLPQVGKMSGGRLRPQRSVYIELFSDSTKVRLLANYRTSQKIFVIAYGLAPRQ